MNKILKISIIFLLVLSLLSIILYVVNFNGGLSDDPNHWGAFGSFITPILTMLTMIILLMNLNMQDREFKYQQRQKYILELNNYISELLNLYYPTSIYKGLVASGKPFNIDSHGEENEFLPHRNDKIVTEAIALDMKIKFISETYISDKLLRAKIHLFKLVTVPTIINFYSLEVFHQPEFKEYSSTFVNFLAGNIQDGISKMLSFERLISVQELEASIPKIEKEIESILDKAIR